MYFFSSWFPSILDNLNFFKEIIYANRGVHGWQSHKTPSGMSFKSLYHTYETKILASCAIESHRNTIDLQYCYSGGELIGFGDKNLIMPEHLSYDISKDKDLWRANAKLTNKVHLLSETFVLFEPNQLHQPQECDGHNKGIEKIVLKLPLNFVLS